MRKGTSDKGMLSGVARVALAIVMIGMVPVALADAWLLDPEASSVRMQTIKANNIGETHSFDHLSGFLSSDGVLSFSIASASVASGIPLRDQRLRDVLFKAVEYPFIRVSAAVSLAELEQLPVGEILLLTLPVEVTLLEETLTLLAELRIARLREDRMLVSTVTPVLVDAGRFKLADAVEALRTLAGLPAISPVVPVSVSTVWRRGAAVLTVTEPRVRAVLPGTSRTAGYFTVHNPAGRELTLIGVESTVAARVEFHETVRRGDQLRMRRLQEVPIAAGETLSFEPGGPHLMFFEVQQGLPESVPVTLRLRGADLPDGFQQVVVLKRFAVTD